MPSPLGTTLFTWAAIYVYVGAFYCVLHLRRPRHREYLAFGLACLGMSLWTVGAALSADAHTLRDGTFALQLSYVGGFAVVAFFYEFAIHVARQRRSRMLLAAYALAAIGIIATVSGLLFDASAPMVWRWVGPTLAPGRVEPALTPLGAALVVLGTGFAAHGAWVATVGVRKSQKTRWFLIAAVVAVMAGAFDTVARILQWRTVHLLEHAGLLPVLAVSWMLLRRFVRAADELGRRTQELRQSYSDLRVTQEELVRKEQLAAVGELSAVIAHEVRNPLAIIKNAVSSLRRPTLRPTDRGVLLGILDEEVDRLNRLVRDLLAYARPVEPRGRPVDLGRIVDEVIVKVLAHHEAPESIDVVLDFKRSRIIHGDPDLLRQAMTSLVENALAAMPGGGKLSVRGHRGGRSMVFIELTDTGEGMDSLVLAKARDPFFTTRAAGTGLGLAIASRVIKNHHGTLDIESAPGEGTTVHITLPVDRPSSVPPPPETR